MSEINFNEPESYVNQPIQEEEIVRTGFTNNVVQVEYTLQPRVQLKISNVNSADDIIVTLEFGKTYEVSYLSDTGIKKITGTIECFNVRNQYTKCFSGVNSDTTSNIVVKNSTDSSEELISIFLIRNIVEIVVE